MVFLQEVEQMTYEYLLGHASQHPGIAFWRLAILGGD